MSMMEKIDLATTQREQCISLLEQRGMFVEVGHDFSEYAAIVRAERSQQPLAPPFDPKKQFLPPKLGFHILGRDDTGKLVHNQAMRLINLKTQSLSSYMLRRYQEFLPTGVSIKPESTWFRPGPGASRISGQVAYHGDLWVDPTGGKFRGGGLVDVLARLAFLECLDYLDADHVFGLMVRKVARTGLAEREGYMHTDPYCMGWDATEYESPLSTNMVYMSRDDLRYTVDVPLDFAA